ncbi:hypothetical protein CERSUDRAFT_118486 [Gelatoporia subvermispora B]|uniref:Uncharacterized protein n=1 Tax=Ceriporiopsis subvermispora (strain B) TaxID=914234 RepID=M2R3D8_CERS8|nr:hypothetical protein CERSUDRAFT_118486 [Gelatoporia subvermispora B]
MSLTRFFDDPFFSFAEFDRLFDEAFAARNFGQPGSGSGNQLQRQSQANDNVARTLRPRMDVHEDSQNNLVTATFELPGLRKEDVNIDIQGNALRISGESRQDSERDENGYHVRERRFGRFARSVPLPQGVKPDEIKASLDNGLLTVTFPKTSAEQAPKRITIS